MSQSYKFSLPLILGLIFLSPLFFIPGGALYLAHAKSFLFAIVLVVALVAYFVEIWKKGSVTFSKNFFFYVVLALPVVYLLSALSASPSSPSLLGYYFEIGTFGYLLLGGVAFYLSATLFTESARILQGLVAFFASISILSVFVAIKILTNGNAFVWGNFEGNMGNPLGNWTDLSLIFVLLAVFATLAIGMIPMKRKIQVALSCVFVLSVALLVITNFMPAIALTFFSAILLYAYFWKIEDHYLFTRNEQGETLSKEANNFFTRGTTLAGALILISLLFFINPTFSGTKLSDKIANISGVQNSDVRPNLSTTINVSKATLSKQAFLGSGPNTFSQDWLAFKPAQINSTPFWGTTFPFYSNRHHWYCGHRIVVGVLCFSNPLYSQGVGTDSRISGQSFYSHRHSSGNLVFVAGNDSLYSFGCDIDVGFHLRGILDSNWSGNGFGSYQNNQSG